ncbi:hypothetical protein PAHAL_9G429700 [Panicum hallii]|uniref:Uncharacterized protein n=1 Tax=Panicum hallii TaxID=206008 RepID=A0A2T8I4F9_9POAL|nr:hypothetical protein PAHAL_9G429700 [Panicum hallii]
MNNSAWAETNAEPVSSTTTHSHHTTCRLNILCCLKSCYEDGFSGKILKYINKKNKKADLVIAQNH